MCRNSCAIQNTSLATRRISTFRPAALLETVGGPSWLRGGGLIGSYEAERRPVGLRNRAGSARHNDVRTKIAALYGDHLHDPNETGRVARRTAADKIGEFGNAENECGGIEFGYVYSGPPITGLEEARRTTAPA
jgi:hypothetical protein